MHSADKDGHTNLADVYAWNMFNKSIHLTCEPKMYFDTQTQRIVVTNFIDGKPLSKVEITVKHRSRFRGG